MHELVRPRLVQAEQTGLPPSHRVLLLRQFLHATWIFLRLGFGKDVKGCGVAALVGASSETEGGDVGTSIMAPGALSESS